MFTYLSEYTETLFNKAANIPYSLELNYHWLTSEKVLKYSKKNKETKEEVGGLKYLRGAADGILLVGAAAVAASRFGVENRVIPVMMRLAAAVLLAYPASLTYSGIEYFGSRSLRWIYDLLTGGNVYRGLSYRPETDSDIETHTGNVINKSFEYLPHVGIALSVASLFISTQAHKSTVAQNVINKLSNFATYPFKV